MIAIFLCRVTDTRQKKTVNNVQFTEIYLLNIKLDKTFAEYFFRFCRVF
jgi:hypothetical protein